MSAPEASSAPAPESDATKASPKSKSQYYYWHGHEKQREAVGDVAPKTSPTLVKTSEEVPKVPKTPVNPITKYSWCNNSKSISVYVDFEGVGALGESAVSMNFTKRTVDVAITKGDKTQTLHLNLSDEIVAETSSFRLKADQVVVKLPKADESKTWFDLCSNKSSFADEE